MINKGTVGYCETLEALEKRRLELYPELLTFTRAQTAELTGYGIKTIYRMPQIGYIKGRTTLAKMALAISAKK